MTSVDDCLRDHGLLFFADVMAHDEITYKSRNNRGPEYGSLCVRE